MTAASAPFAQEGPEPLHRSQIAQNADYFGYVPAIGSMVGIGRMVSSAAIGSFAWLAKYFSKGVEHAAKFLGCHQTAEWFADHKDSFSLLSISMKNEFIRGALELLPLVTLVLDFAKGFHETHVISNLGGAHGRFMYPTTDEKGICYSFNRVQDDHRLAFSKDTFGIKGEVPRNIEPSESDEGQTS